MAQEFTEEKDKVLVIEIIDLFGRANLTASQANGFLRKVGILIEAGWLGYFGTDN